MVMTCRHTPSTARLVLLVLLTVTPHLAGTAPVGGEGGEGEVEGRTRTHRKEDSLSPFFSLPSPLNTPPHKDQGQNQGSPTDMDHARVLASVLLEVLDHPRGAETQWRGERERGEGQREEPVSLEARGGEETMREGEEEEEERRVGEEERERMEQLGVALVAAALGEEKEEVEEAREERKRSEGERGWLMEDEGVPIDGGSKEGGEQEEEDGDDGGEGGILGWEARLSSVSEEGDPSLRRKTRGYFQNIDLGLQDNEILPPLKGYKAYNTQLAQAGKKLRWQEEQAGNSPVHGGNFMDDFENEAEEEEEEVEEEEESLTRAEEEARARAEQQEVQRQQEEAERARKEEQRLADIASDMLLQYMGRKQQGAPYLKPRQKSSLGSNGNAAEDKRSEEVAADDDDLDQQMIDRLIEISSKLHLPADDVVEIISDVEEKKKKRKELPPSNNPIAPRYRPLVPPPLATGPMYHYTVSSNPKKAPYAYKPNKKWQKDKANAKYYKQEYWYKPQKQQDYWYKPQKQFLAFPSYPYYQKPYRAYYPVYFPYPKPRYYGKPSPSRDQPLDPQDYGLPPPRRRHRAGAKARGQGWRQQPAARLPPTPYISNYILPHPRTYQPLPPPKPRSPPGRGRRPPYFYPPVTPVDDYEEDGLVPQMDSEEELENFIERIYMKRRMY